VNTVLHGRYDYATLDDFPVNGVNGAGCHRLHNPGPLPVPPNGWAIAPNTHDVRLVVRQHDWGTNCMLLSDGTGWYNRANAPGNDRLCGNGNWLGRDANGDYYATACNRRILIRRLRSEDLFQPTQIVRFGRYDFATLDNHPFDDTEVGCGDTPYPLPKGWELAPNNELSRDAAFDRNWGTHCMLLSDGTSWKGKWYGAGNSGSCGDGYLANNQVGYYARSCNRRVLIRRFSEDEPVFSVSYQGYKYATLDNYHPSSSNNGCQSWSERVPLPKGWEVAPHTAASKEVAAMYDWGTHCLIMSDGTSWRNRAGGGLSAGACGGGQLKQDGNGAMYAASCSRRILIRKGR